MPLIGRHMISRALAAAAFALLLACGPAWAASQPAPAASPDNGEIPPKVHDLLELLKDPSVQDWLKNMPKTAAPAGCG